MQPETRGKVTCSKMTLLPAYAYASPSLCPSLTMCDCYEKKNRKCNMKKLLQKKMK